MNFKSGKIIPLLIAAVLATGCKKENKDSAAQMPPMEVDVAEVLVDSVMIYRDYPGQLEATNVVEIVAKVDGQILGKHFKAGDIVNKGQLLYTIDDTQYRNTVEQMQGQLDNAISSTEYYKKNYEAMKKALEKDAVSEMEVLQAKSNYESGLASIKTAKANLQTAQTNLGYCRITSPMTGRISETTVDVGNYVAGTASPKVLATIYDNRTFYATFYIEDATYLHVGQNGNQVKAGYGTIPLKFQEQMQHEYNGKFNYVAPNVDSSTGTLAMKAQIDNSYNELRDGMFVTVSLPYQYNPQALLVLDASIGTDQSGRYLYIVNEKNEVIYTPVKVGSLVQGKYRVIEEGLKPGQKYVTKALLKVRNGMKVKPKEVSA